MAERKVRMKIFGMTCDDCVRTVSEGLRSSGASDISIDLKSGMASFIIDDSRTDPDKLQSIPVFSGESHYKGQVRNVD
ncbi:MAG: heavy-metal-associated domain-containing protein [Candidatus Thermoplasmatota archaeon]|jgi:copper chaperone CopZ|nr:heavy-metal-associated domain-containing protein [Candidatus Thermoplasmatota archaeon]